MPVARSPDQASCGIDLDPLSNTICAMCSEVIQGNEDQVETPCNHYFHSKCINTWLGENQTCPVPASPQPGRRTGTIPRDRINTRGYLQNNPHLRLTTPEMPTARQPQSPRNRRGGGHHESNHNAMSEERVRDLIVESMNVFRAEITNGISNYLQQMMASLNLADNRPHPSTSFHREEPPTWPRDAPYDELRSNRGFPNERRH